MDHDKTDFGLSASALAASPGLSQHDVVLYLRDLLNSTARMALAHDLSILASLITAAQREAERKT